MKEEKGVLPSKSRGGEKEIKNQKQGSEMNGFEVQRKENEKDVIKATQSLKS